MIHAAGHAHSNDYLQHHKVNVIGTKNLLKGLQDQPPKQFVFISSISVYGLKYGNTIREETPILAMDSYGISKVQAEAEVVQWCHYFGVKLTILRLPLVVGSNPPGNLHDMIKAIQKGYYFNISSGVARRSMVLAQDIAKFILLASEAGGTYNLSDGYHPSYAEMSACISEQLHGHKKIINISKFLANILAKLGDKLNAKWFPFNSNRFEKLTQDLIIDDSLARARFGWSPKKVIGNFRI